MEVQLGTTTGVIQANFLFLPLSRAIDNFLPPGLAPLTPYISALGVEIRKLDDTSSGP